MFHMDCWLTVSEVIKYRMMVRWHLEKEKSSSSYRDFMSFNTWTPTCDTSLRRHMMSRNTFLFIYLFDWIKADLVATHGRHTFYHPDSETQPACSNSRRTSKIPLKHRVKRKLQWPRTPDVSEDQCVGLQPANIWSAPMHANTCLKGVTTSLSQPTSAAAIR